jgi:tetratricopeptide (TPR) repeat protein
LLVVDYLLEVRQWRGRDELLAALRQDLFDDFTDGAEKPKVIALIGQGGIGKSSLVVKLLENIGVNWRRQELAEFCAYDGVVCLKTQVGTGFDDIAGQLLTFLGYEQQSLNKPEQKIKAILEGLRQGAYLVVMDNLESILQPATAADVGRSISPEVGELLNQLVYAPHRSQVLLTSREYIKDLADKRGSGTVVNPSLVREVNVEGISIENGVKLLQDYGLQDSEADLRWVVERVGGHALLLELLAGLARNKRGYLRKNSQLVSNNARTIILEQLQRQTEEGRELLKRMCVLRVGIDVPGLNFLRLYQEPEEYENLAKMIDFEEYFENRRARQEAKENELVRQIPDTQKIVDQLSACSLLRCRYDEVIGEELYDLHQLIAEYLQTEFESELPDLFQRVYSFYRSGKTIDNPKTIEDLQPLLESQHFAFQLGNYAEAVGLVSWKIQKHLKPWGYWTQLHNLTSQVLPHAKNIDYRICCQILGDIHNDWGNWDKAQEYFQLSLEHAQKNNVQGGIAVSYGLLGDIESNRGNWDAAESLYNQKLDICTELGDRAGIAYVTGSLGYVESNRGNWDAAESLYNQSLDIHRELGDRAGIASSYRVLGVLERNRKNWDTAKSFFDQSFEIYKQLGDKKNIATSYLSLGRLEINQESWMPAKVFLNQYLETMQELCSRDGIAMAIADLAKIELGQGNLETAESLLRDALQQMESLVTKNAIAEVNWDFARLELRKSNHPLATQYYQTAHRLFSELGAAKDLERIESEWSMAITPSPKM